MFVETNAYVFDLKCIYFIYLIFSVFSPWGHFCYKFGRSGTGFLNSTQGGEGGGVALGRILFVLPKMWSKLELSLMRLLRAKFGKNCQWTKKIKDAVVYGWGTPIFPKWPKENKNSLNMSAACLLRKIDAQ